jgi:hypothetical protein
MTNLSRIELLKAKLKEEKQKKENSGNFGNDIYPFWQMEVGQEARVRILPDKNEDNPFMFYVDRMDHKISINGEDKKIPCRKMYGDDCPICELSRKFYKDEGKESKDGKYYYRSKTALVRILVIEDPLPPNKDTGETFAGKVCNTQFGFQLMEKIKEQIGSDDLGDFTDFNEGFDFIIKKTPQGKYGTYSVGSQFARRSSAIPEELQETIELIDLSTLLPKNMEYEKVHNMLQAHLSGEEYSEDSDDSSDTGSEKKETVSEKVVESKKEEKKVTAKKNVAPAVKDEEEEDEDDVVESSSDDDDDDDIFARLLAKRNAAKK